MSTDINVSQLVINKLTKAQYDEARSTGNISESELYLVTDDNASIAEEVVSAHNNSSEAHADIRAAITNIEIPTAVSQLINDNNFATVSEVESKVAALVNSAPDKLNTLDELAAALGDDENFANTVTSQISSKQDKLSGISGQVVGFDSTGKAVAQEAPRTGTLIVMSDTTPTDLSNGDYWDMIMTTPEAPIDMFLRTVSIVNGVGYTVTPTVASESTVMKGNDYSFTVTFSRGYEAGSGFIVEANGIVLNAVNGVYTITNITVDQIITVNGVVEIDPAIMSISGTGNASYCYVRVNGTKYYATANNVEVFPGDVITFGVKGTTSYNGIVSINNSEKLRVTSGSVETYNWTVPAGTKTISMYLSYVNNLRQQISVTVK